MENEFGVKEDRIIKGQRIALVIGFVFFFPSLIISGKLFGTMKYGALELVFVQLYLGISAIKNRISIMRVRGQKENSRGQRAVVIGFIIILSAISLTLFILTSSLADQYFPYN